MKNLFSARALLFTVVATILVPVEVLTAQSPQHTQTAQQCISRRDYPAGTNNVANAFTRFYNTCNVNVFMFIATPASGNNGPGITVPGSFMQWSPGASTQAETFACVAPGKPVVPGGGAFPSFGSPSFECLVTDNSAHVNW